jgi:DNA-binding response OmpR family regulator
MALRSILLVEDDDALRSVLSRHLRARGYEVEEADSTESARRILSSGSRPSAVLLDINLPGETGWSLLRDGDELSAAGDPPVVIASATTISPRRLEEFGVAGYLPKPFPLETLLSTLERLLDPEDTSS